MAARPRIAVGTPQSCVDGPLNVAGRALRAADHAIDRVVYAAVVDSNVGRRHITAVDTAPLSPSPACCP